MCFQLSLTVCLTFCLFPSLLRSSLANPENHSKSMTFSTEKCASVLSIHSCIYSSWYVGQGDVEIQRWEWCGPCGPGTQDPVKEYSALQKTDNKQRCQHGTLAVSYGRCYDRGRLTVFEHGSRYSATQEASESIPMEPVFALACAQLWTKVCSRVAVGTLSSLASPSGTCSFPSPHASPLSTSMALGKLSIQLSEETSAGTGGGCLPEMSHQR